MISNCIFTWGFTREGCRSIHSAQLWIDFKLYFYVRIHKCISPLICVSSVVNWFQIVFLREDSQADRKNNPFFCCCELISNCIFTWGFTSVAIAKPVKKWLWIDFKLYFYVRIHKRRLFSLSPWIVVNWFQIVFLREDSQVSFNNWQCFARCELISNCIFTWGFTRTPIKGSQNKKLWIDFKLYFYVRIHKFLK